MKESGQISIAKSLCWTILKKTGILFLMLKKNDVNHSFDNFLLTMNELLGKHVPFKKGKSITKPWITTAIHKSILVTKKSCLENSLNYKIL